MAADRLLMCLAAAGLLVMAGTARAQSTITCESSGGQYRSCPVDTSGGVTLSRQLSREGCWQGDIQNSDFGSGHYREKDRQLDVNRHMIMHFVRCVFGVSAHYPPPPVPTNSTR